MEYFKVLLHRIVRNNYLPICLGRASQNSSFIAYRSSLVSVPHQNRSKCRDEGNQDRSHADGKVHVTDECEYFFPELRVAGQNFFFQFFPVENVGCAEFDAVAVQNAVCFEDFSPEINIYEQHCHKKANDDRNQ